MAKAKAKVPHITKDDIERYLQLEEERRELNRLAKAKGDLAAEIEEKIEAFARANGGSDLTVERSGFILAIKTKAGTVAWKHEFIKLTSEEEAERLKGLCPRVEFLSVERKS